MPRCQRCWGREALLCASFGFPAMSHPTSDGPPPRRSGERRGLKSEGAEESPWRGAVGSRHALPLSKGQPRLQARSGTQVPLIDLSAGTRR